MTRSVTAVCLIVAAILNCFADAFVASVAKCNDSKLKLQSVKTDDDGIVSRRSAFFKAAASVGVVSTLFSSEAFAEADDGTRGGVPLNPFNGLTFNYRGNEFGGLDASTLNEPSIPYQEFLERMDKGEVEFVEFIAPDGDAAYATFKSKEVADKPIRIGEGYPVEQHDGWSSPAFVVKSVKKNGVPYKFTVPGLAAYK